MNPSWVLTPRNSTAHKIASTMWFHSQMTSIKLCKRDKMRSDLLNFLIWSQFLALSCWPKYLSKIIEVFDLLFIATTTRYVIWIQKSWYLISSSKQKKTLCKCFFHQTGRNQNLWFVKLKEKKIPLGLQWLYKKLSSTNCGIVPIPLNRIS